MRLITLFPVLFVLLFASLSAYKINKCCPEGHMYGVVEDQPVCVSVNNSSKYNWLPESVNETIKNKLNISFNDSQCSTKFAEWSFGFDLKRPNDSLKFVNESSFFLDNEETYKDSSFCLDNLKIRTFVIKVARKCPCLEKACILKCCGDKQTLNNSNRCVDTKNATNWQMKTSKAGKYRTLHQFPDCESKNKTLMYVSKYKLNTNGSISLNGKTVKEHDEYCGDFKQENGGNRADTIIACFTINELKITTESKINGAMSLVGAFFFLITSIILVWIPELGGSPKWSMVIHVSGFFVANASLAYQKFLPKLSGDMFCKIIAFVMQFSLMASFFWLNVMCIDLSLTFGSMKSMVFKKYTERRNFIIYSLYAWGGSSLITLATVIAEFTSTNHYSPLKPNFGQNKCWFAETEALWIFFIGPIGLLLCFNLGLLMYASFQIIKIKRDTKALKNDDSRIRYRKRHVKRYSLYLKIFMLMGIPWLTEIVSWAITNEEIEWHYYWYIIDFVNIVKAVSIFIIFCCKEKVWVEAKKVAPCLHHCEKLVFSCLCKKRAIDVDMKRHDSVFTITGLSESVTDTDTVHISATSGENYGTMQSGCIGALVSVYSRIKITMLSLNIKYFHLIFGICLSSIVVIIIRYLFDISTDFPVEQHVFNVSRFLENFDTNLIDK